MRKIPNQIIRTGARTGFLTDKKPVMYEVSRRFIFDMVLLTITLSSIMFVVGVQVGKFFK